MNDVLFHFRERPGIADRSTALGDHTGEMDLAADGNGDAAFFEYLAIEINLRGLLGEIAAGESAQHRRGRIGLIPGAEPALAIQMERIDKSQPTIGLIGFDACLETPIAGTIGFLNLFLSKMHRL